MPVFDFMKDAKAADTGRKLTEIPVASIHRSPYQPRVTFDEESIAELAQSIRQVGLIQPLVVRKAPEGGYELVAGERRLRAVKSLGMEKVTCIVEQSVQDESSAMMALIENLQREDLHYLEEAAAIAEPYFRENYGMEVYGFPVISIQTKNKGICNCVQAAQVDGGSHLYSLLLDQKNEPWMDDVAQVGEIEAMEERYPDGLKAEGTLPDYDEGVLGTRFHSEDQVFQTRFTLTTHVLPQSEDADAVWELLQAWKEAGGEKLELCVGLPDFLPQESGPEVGALLSRDLFPGMSRKEFDAVYADYVDGIFWDESMFQEMAGRLEEAGYQDVSYEVTGYDEESRTLEIGCDVRMPEGVTEDTALSLVPEMEDEIYLRIRDKTVSVSLYIYD